MKKNISPLESFYSLNLKDGSNWSFIPADNYSSFLINKMSNFLDIRRSSSLKNKKIILASNFLNQNSINNIILHFSKFYPELPEANWHLRDFGIVKYLTHYNSPFIICDIGSEASTTNDLIRIERFLYIIYEHIIYSGGFPVHGALIKKEGKAVIIGAPGGTGKSTCCDRLPEPWHALSDDMSLVIKEKTNTYNVHPLPTWKYVQKGLKNNWKIEEKIPLKVVFLLEQSDKDKAIPVKRNMGALRLTQLSLQICQPHWKYLSVDEIRKVKTNIFSNTWELTSKIPVYTLLCSRTGKFWEEIEEAVRLKELT